MVRSTTTLRSRVRSLDSTVERHKRRQPRDDLFLDRREKARRRFPPASARWASMSVVGPLGPAALPLAGDVYTPFRRSDMSRLVQGVA